LPLCDDFEEAEDLDEVDDLDEDEDSDSEPEPVSLSSSSDDSSFLGLALVAATFGVDFISILFSSSSCLDFLLTQATATTATITSRIIPTGITTPMAILSSVVKEESCGLRAAPSSPLVVNDLPEVTLTALVVAATG